MEAHNHKLKKQLEEKLLALKQQLEATDDKAERANTRKLIAATKQDLRQALDDCDQKLF